ncbi:MAG: DUF362 domain-containing protein, partial [Candidatus Poribacteria bacterium]
MEKKLSRREFLKSSAKVALAMSAFSAVQLNELRSEEIEKNPDLVIIKSKAPEKAVLTAIETIGGISKFVKSNDVVIVKPNMAFPNPPDWGSTTNPIVVASIVRLCLDAGAKSILIIDNPMDRPEQCL